MKPFKLLFFCLAMLFNSLNGQILFSEYAEGTSYNKYLEIYNYSSQTIYLNEYAFPSCSNGCDNNGEWDYMNYFPEGATIIPGDVYVITHPFATNSSNEYYTAEIAMYSDHQFTYLSNGDDVFALINIKTGDVLDIIGDIGEDPGDGWDVAGVVNATKDHTLIRKSSVYSGNLGQWSNSAGTSLDDSEWIVLDNEVWENLGFHNYDGGGSSEILGCMCEEATNYMPTATLDDGSCIVDNGCSDPLALNYSGFVCDSAEFVNENCQYETIDASGCYWCDLALNYFDFNYQITASNMTIAISDVSNLVNGDIIGVFYSSEEGYIKCGGASVYDNSQNIAIAAWGDDPSSAFIDGFQTGDSFMFLILREGVVYATNTILNNTESFSNTYANNNFGQVLELDISNEFIEDCLLPLGVSDDCNEFFDMTEYDVDSKIILNVDLLGRIIHTDYQGFGFSIYKDGAVEKKYFSNH